MISNAPWIVIVVNCLGMSTFSFAGPSAISGDLRVVVVVGGAAGGQREGAAEAQPEAAANSGMGYSHTLSRGRMGFLSQ